MYEKMKTGTTTVGLVFSEGVVLAADRRVSAGHMVVSKRGRKIHMLADYVGMTISGLVADAQKIVEFLSARIRKFRIERGRNPLISEISRYTSLVMHSYFKSYIPLYTHLIIGGVDKHGPHVFFLDMAGSLMEDNFIASGSGSPVAFGFLEGSYKFEPKELNEEEAIKIAVNAIASAIARDLATGDGIDVVVIKQDGYRRLTGEEVKKFLRR